MSALGQKQTFALQKGVSALPPKADIDRLREGSKSHKKFATAVARSFAQKKEPRPVPPGPRGSCV